MIADEAARTAIRERTDRTMFVVAGAGSGKTTALIERIATLVLRDGVPLASIAAVTFTEKAGAELRDRLRARFEDAVRADTAVDAAERALTELDMAAIGTLHSFAARVLTLHAIEAGLPPQLKPADEIGSGIAEEEEWNRALVRLLDDEAIRPALHRALMSVRMDRLAALYTSLNKDWDLIESHILRHPLPALRVPDLRRLHDAAARLTAVRASAATDDDALVGHIDDALAWVAALKTDDDLGLYEALQGASSLYEVAKADGGFKQVGRAGTWKGLPGGSNAAKGCCADLREVAVELARQAQGVVLQHITRWMAEQVLLAAKERQRAGELTFQDLLVVSRQVLRDRPDVAEALSRRYTHLLLDEFQDTDPIQIELAVRIAGGADGARHDDWRSIETCPGSLFVVGDPKQSIYRFRRANIALYLEVRAWFTSTFGEDSVVELQTNFRSVPGILDWVNGTFGRLIRFVDGQQPPYLALNSPPDAEAGPAPSVTYLGWDAHGFRHNRNASALRKLEAAGVAGVIVKAMAEGWTVRPGGPHGQARPLRKSDIAILVPARTSLPMLKAALDEAEIAHRAEASTLLYLSEDVADLMMAVQSVADLSDEFALVMTLRSALFGVGDDDLWRWKQAGGRFSLSGFRPGSACEEVRALPVFEAMVYLRRLAWDAPRMAPADLLARIVRERRVLEVAADTPSPSEAADRWRRIRFVVDQARAWSEVSHGGIRAYLEWAKRQTSETAQVYEAVLPETDVDAVRVMTIHAAKGLEFPMVVLSGMTSLPASRPRDIKLLWTRDGHYAVNFVSGVETSNYSIEAPIDEAMGDEERKRLLYVATTRARDHLVVSLHRADGDEARTPAEIMRRVVPDDATIAARFDVGDGEPGPAALSGAVSSPVETREELLERLGVARRLSLRPPSQSASGLEGSDPDVVLAVAGEEDEPLPVQGVPLAKDQRDLDTPSYNKGRDATAIGIAVHAVLQTIDLATGDGLDALVGMQCLAGGVPQHAERVAELVRRALASDEVRAAAVSEHWRESLLVMTTEDGDIVEGYADLIYRDGEGAVHIIDYKTDAIRSAAELAEREAFYAPQLRAYEAMVREAIGVAVRARPLFLDCLVV